MEDVPLGPSVKVLCKKGHEWKIPHFKKASHNLLWEAFSCSSLFVLPWAPFNRFPGILKCKKKFSLSTFNARSSYVFILRVHFFNPPDVP
jgi:hypothetical protein